MQKNYRETVFGDLPAYAMSEKRKLRGLEKVCRAYGRMNCGGILMAWDYVNEVALPEKELLADKTRWAASERAKWAEIKSASQPPLPPQPARKS